MKKISDFEKMVEDQTVLCEIQGITEELFTYSEKEREKLLVKIIDKIVCIISNAENDIFSFYDDIEEIISWYKDANGIFAGKEKKKVQEAVFKKLQEILKETMDEDVEDILNSLLEIMSEMQFSEKQTEKLSNLVADYVLDKITNMDFLSGLNIIYDLLNISEIDGLPGFKLKKELYGILGKLFVLPWYDEGDFYGNFEAFQIIDNLSSNDLIDKRLALRLENGLIDYFLKTLKEMTYDQVIYLNSFLGNAFRICPMSNISARRLINGVASRLKDFFPLPSKAKLTEEENHFKDNM